MTGETILAVASMLLAAPFVDGAKHPERFLRAKPVIQVIAALISCSAMGYAFGYSSGSEGEGDEHATMVAFIGFGAGAYILFIELFSLYLSHHKED